MGPDGMWWGGRWMFPVAMPILMVAVLVGVLYLIFGRGGYGPHGRRDSEPAIEILKKRYAKGEINREEFEQMKRDLNA
jgi:putative membrane protein